MDLRIAVFGFSLAAFGLVALTAGRRVPLPVVLEFERPRAA
jgi:hypothetical protein